MQETQKQAISVQVGKYREVNKGALKAFFEVILQPGSQKILDCKLFEKGTQSWIGWPSKEYKKPGQEKPEYIPLVAFLDREYSEALKVAVVAAIDKLKSASLQEPPF